MRILVAGRKGQVAKALHALSGQRGVKIFAMGRPDLDICDRDSINRAINLTNPNIVINTAAFTDVDLAEAESDLAFSVNHIGARNVAEVAAAAGLGVIHLSTNYVFAGDKSGPHYVETDPTGPCNVYGHSKLAGEQAVENANPNHLILRTAWVYSAEGKNFLKTMLKLAHKNDEISVVADQWGNPTSASDIAFAIVGAAISILNNTKPNWTGIFHLCGTGATNWAQFARQIVAFSAQHGGPCARINDITTAEYPTPAIRPSKSEMSSALFEQHFGIKLPEWQASSELVVRQVLGSEG